MRDIVRAATLLLVCLVTFTIAWSKEDHEIFRLRDEVLAGEGHNATFYSFLGVGPTASNEEINKAYRALSRRLHPDKARSTWLANYNKPQKPNSKPGAKPTVHVQKDKKPSQSEITKFNKEASARFERLSLVTNVLRGPERERYDHFLRNGFPVWRGTGYYYERFRPGLGTVLLGLFVFVGGAVHYGAMYLSWKRKREFVERYIKHARKMAWGDEAAYNSISGIGEATGASTSTQRPQESEESMQWNRKQKRAMEREKRKEGKNPVKSARAAEKAKTSGISTPVEAEVTSGPVGAKKRTVAENGKVLIVDSVGNVFLEEETEEGERQEFLLDPDEVPVPSINDTFLIRLPVFLYNQSLGKVLNKQTADHIEWEAEGGEQEQVDEVEASLRSAIPANANGESRKRKSKAK
ncbi:J domain-containing [Lecanosticta acicola]|uniref:J domain-containing n=1 Tax=Lecanosticta acicola TaxID=111012 RepID=A0AAI8Z0B5_9PEZI|nr:J domain-containing [Lecanosticta acicola]